jgi:saccharopine dehydrogenase (NAD+, L-lysine-forming)
MRACVLGCGEIGEETVTDLYEHGTFDEIIVATRTPSRAEELINRLHGRNVVMRVARVDAADVPAVASLMSGCSVAVNCAGPNYKYEVPVALAAIAAGVNLVDVNDEYEVTFEMLDLHARACTAGILIVMGLGGSPGIDNVLVRAAVNQLDVVEEIHTAWVMSGADPGGLALAYHLLYSLSGRALTYENGELREVRSFVDGREMRSFPEPVGDMEVFHIGHPEPITFSRTFPAVRCADNKATFNPAWVNHLICQLGSVARDGNRKLSVSQSEPDAMDIAATALHGVCKHLNGVPPEAALRVDVAGWKRQKRRRIVFSSAGRLAKATGIPAAIGAIMLSQGKILHKGVLPPEACIEPDEFLYEMIDRRNVAQLNGWIED